MPAEALSPESRTHMPATAIDLFSGAGGFSLGLERAGFRLLFAADSWTRAVTSYRSNFSHPCLHVDLSQLSAADLLLSAGLSGAAPDLVVGGPPCQGFSIQRIGADSDKRNSLVLEFARLVSELRPRMFVMENVPGLAGVRGRDLLDEFQAKMSLAGYEMTTDLVDAASFGVPQTRRRLLIIGWLGSTLRSFNGLSSSRSGLTAPTVWEAIGDLPNPPLAPNEAGTDPLHRRTRLSPLNLERLGHIPPGGGMQDLPIHLRANCHRDGAARIGHRYVYGRLAPDRPAATITARFDSFTRGRFAHPFDNRNITLREGARLQSFPDSFRFDGNQEDVAALIGNAVPPLLAEAVARAVYKHLMEPSASETRASIAGFTQRSLFHAP